MRYAIIDVETTGVDPDVCQMVALACVCVDDERPKTAKEMAEGALALLIPPDRHIRCEPGALAIHEPSLWAQLCVARAALEKDSATSDLCRAMERVDGLRPWGHRSPTWLACADVNVAETVKQYVTSRLGEGRFTIAGKNPNFDLRFLEAAAPSAYADQLGGLVKHRLLDPGPMFVLPADAEVPGLRTCVNRAHDVGTAITAREIEWNIANRPHDHDPVTDAIDVALCLRVAYELRLRSPVGELEFEAMSDDDVHKPDKRS